MATRTLGTNATTTLTAIPFPDLTSASPAADFAAIQQAIIDDTPLAYTGAAFPTGTPSNVFPGAFSTMGTLYVPNRGTLKIFPGDWVAVDATGWPILLSGRALAGVTGGPAVSWTHSGALT